MTITKPARKRRRWWFALTGLLSLIVGLAAVLPWALGTQSARRWLIGQANQALAPARLDFAAIRLSWFRPTQLTSVVLHDAQGDRVIDAPRVNWDRNLWQILFQRPRLGTIVLDRARLDVERRADGTVDVYEALKPLFRKDPRTDLHVRIRQGRLRFRSAGQAVPVEAERAELALEVPPAPRPLRLRLTLENAETPRPATLDIQFQDDRWKHQEEILNELTVNVAAVRWPWAIRASGLDSSGRLDGGLVLKRRSGNWGSTGEVSLLELDATGPPLAGDHLRLDRVAGSWTLSETAGAWTVHSLDLQSPVGSLRASGDLDAARQTAGRIEGTLDLAALARQAPHALRLREGIVLDRGSAHLRLQSRVNADSQAWDVEARISDLRARDHDRAFALHDPATLSALVVRRRDGLAVERMDVQTAFLKATGQGDLERGVSWTGTVDLGGFQRQLRDLVDFGAVDLAGQGEVSGHYRRVAANYEGRLSADLHAVRLAGLAPGKLEREAVRMTLSLSGPTASSGLPLGWSRGRLNLNSGPASAELSATSEGGVNALALVVQSALDSTDRPPQAEGRLEASWDESRVSVDRLRLALDRVNGAGAIERVVVEARGRYDRLQGDLLLTPVGDRGPRALALAPEGFEVRGIGRAGGLRISGGLVGELEPLARLVWPKGDAPVKDLSGTWMTNLAAETTDDALRLVGKIDFRPLLATGENGPGERVEPISLSCNVLYPFGADRLEIAELVLASRFANLEGSGRVNELAGRRVVDLRGTLTPDWKVIDRLLSERIEPGAHVLGKSSAWRVKGPLSGESAADRLGSLDGEFGVQLGGADIYGLHVGPAPIVVRTREGRLVLDTIDTTLNGGRIHLQPELSVDEELGLTLRLGATSSIANAEINDEVSRRFLSYVAPVLDRATRAHGRVSVSLEDAVFPLGGSAQAKLGTKVEGQVVFQDVEFLPGPFADQLFDLIGQADRPSLKLDEPVALTIADRRVYQRGMAIPLGRLTRIELEGWVDFDRNIRLTASLPITPAMVGNAPILSDIVEGQRVSVPIRGTLKEPQIDREAMNLALKDLGKSLLENGAVRGAAELLMRLRPRPDPNAPPPLTRDQRKSRRLERKAERRAGPRSNP